MVAWVTAASAGRELLREYIEARTGADAYADKMSIPVPVPDPARQRVTS